MLSLYEPENGILHIVQHEGRTHFVLQVTDLNVVHLQTLYVADKESIGGNVAEHVGLRVCRLFLGWLALSLRYRASAFVENLNIVEFQVFNVVTGDSTDDRAILRVGVINRHVADGEPPDRSNSRGLLGSSRAITEPDKDGRIDDIAHRDVVDRDILEDAAIHFLERESARVVEDDVRYRDVLESAIRFCPELQAPCGAALAVGLWVHSFVRAVQKRTFVVSADLRVRNRDVLRGARKTQRVVALQADCVVEWRVDADIRNANIAARIDIDAVTIRIDLYIVNREIVHAGCEDREVAAVQNRDIPDQNIAR